MVEAPGGATDGGAQGPSAGLSLSSFASGMAVTLPISGVAAFYMGWEYLRAFYGEFGIPIAALGYSPHEILLRSSRLLLFAGGPVVGFVVGVFGGRLRSIGAGPPSRNRLVASLIAVGTVVSGLVAAILGLWSLLAAAAYLLSILLVASFWTGGDRTHSVLLGFAVFLVVFNFAPAGLGRLDAWTLAERLEDRSKVSLTTSVDVHLPTTTRSGAAYLSGPMHLVVQGRDSLFLVEADDLRRIYLVPKEHVLGLTYHAAEP